MEKITHKIVSVNGINMHVAELGKGPLVLFLHGFPELWYSWRHQILFLAAQGYRAVAPDLRGYGDTTGAPNDDPSKFTVIHLVGDLIELLQCIAPEEDKVFVVGHDWGAIIAWYLCMFRPEKEPGDIEAELALIGVKTCIKNIFAFRRPGPLYFPKGKGFSANTDSSTSPASWLSEEDLDYFVSRFEKTGFTGGVNYYRAMKLDWEVTAPWSGAKVMVPTKFIVGDLDLVYHMPGAKEYIHNGGFNNDVPLLEDVVVLKGVAHFINQEAPEQVNNHIINFLNKF
nr:bifunctional epoxide hydrolase 2-like isoform X1 [Ipomoea trifida]